MKKDLKRRLSLVRTTIRQLRPESLQGVVGGIPPVSKMICCGNPYTKDGYCNDYPGEES